MKTGIKRGWWVAYNVREGESGFRRVKGDGSGSQINTVQLWDVDNATLDPFDDLLDSRTVTINHPPGAWDGLLIPYQTTVLLVMAAGEVRGNNDTSGEASAQVYQYLVEPTPYTADLSSIANPIDVP